MGKSQQPVLEFDRVSFDYGAVPVLRDVSFSVEPRDFIGIIGPNGGGKTTLIKLALGLLTPAQGSIRVLGTRPDLARSRIGYVPQAMDFDRDFPISVLDLVLMGRLSRRSLIGRYRPEDKDAAWRALESVEVADLAHRPLSDLSGGQRQRVFIARALATEPEILMLDEPTASVDSQAERDIYELLRKLNRQMTIILVTHDLGFISSYVNKVACVNREVALHPTEDITGETILMTYNRSVNMIQHRCHL
ncbi:MAG: ABC transporter ATP-binding protein [Firmicutes bacterium]|nr:ABC transporter ATP-binding protein [Bacillota bacterium]